MSLNPYDTGPEERLLWFYECKTCIWFGQTEENEDDLKTHELCPMCGGEVELKSDYFTY